LTRAADSGRMTGYSEAIQLDDKSDNRKLTCYVNLSHYAIVKHPISRYCLEGLPRGIFGAWSCMITRWCGYFSSVFASK